MISWALVDKGDILQESEVDKMNEMQGQEGTIEGPTKLYEVLGLIEELHDEADLCRNETATDIAYMLETAADMIDSLKEDVLTLTRRLMGENEESFAPETLEVFRRWSEVCMVPNAPAQAPAKAAHDAGN